MLALTLLAAAVIGLTCASESSELPEIEHYNRTVFCEFIHENVMPYGRLNLEFEEVSSDFDPTDKDYQAGVVSTMVPAAVIGVLSVIFFSFRCIYKTCVCCCRLCGCRKCCCRDKKDAVAGEDPEKKRCCLCRRKPRTFTCLFAFSTLVVICGVVFGFFMNKKVTEGVVEIRDALNSIDDNNDNVIDSLTGVNSSLTAFKKDADTFATSYKAVSSGNGDTDIDNAVSQIGTYVDASVSFIGEGIDQFGDASISEDLEETKDFDDMREYAQLGVLIALCMPYFFVLLTLFFGGLQNSCFLSFIVVYSAIIGFIGWVVTAVETGASAAVSDLCYAPDEYLNRTATTIDEDGMLGELVMFYVNCDGTNPLQAELDSSIDAMTDSVAELGKLEDEIDLLEAGGIATAAQVQDLRDKLAALNTSNTALTTSAQVLSQTVFTCNAIHNVYVDALNGLCDSGLTGLAALALVQGLESFCIFIAIYTMLKFVSYANAGKAPAFMRNSFSGFMYKDDHDEFEGKESGNANERL